jgi:hypothetical protein
LPLDAVETLAPYVPKATLLRVRVVTGAPGAWLPWLLGFGATTIGHWVFFRPGRFRTDTAQGLALIAHEAGHVMQFAEMGLWQFFGTYLKENLAVGLRRDAHGMEVPLMELQRRVRDGLREAGWP